MRERLSRLSARAAFVGLLLAAWLALTAGIEAANGRPMLDAARDGNWDAVRAALKQGVPVNDRLGDGSTALHWAAHWNNSDMVSALIVARANVNAVDDDGIGPLALACVNGNCRHRRSPVESRRQPERGPQHRRNADHDGRTEPAT